jgi:hypothetical protein
MRTYGAWAGYPAGTEEDPKCCVIEVWDQSGRSMISHQCSRKRGYGPSGLYCKQHSKKSPAWLELRTPIDK